MKYKAYLGNITFVTDTDTDYKELLETYHVKGEPVKFAIVHDLQGWIEDETLDKLAERCEAALENFEAYLIRDLYKATVIFDTETQTLTK